MYDVVPNELYDYLSKNLNLSKKEIKEVYEKFYFKNRVTALDMGMSTLATLDYFLKRDIKSDLKRYYLLSLLREVRNITFIPIEGFIAYNDLDDLMKLFECKPLFRFLSMHKKLSLGDLAKDIKSHLSKTDLTIFLDSNVNKEFTLALYFALSRIHSKTYLKYDSKYSCIDTNYGIYEYLGCHLKTVKYVSFKLLYFDRDIFRDESETYLHINVEPGYRIVAYSNKGFNEKYGLRRKEKYRVIRRIK